MGLFSLVAKLCERERAVWRRGLNKSVSRTHGTNAVRNLCVVEGSSEILTGETSLVCLLPELEGHGCKNKS